VPGIVDTTVLIEIAVERQPIFGEAERFAASSGPALRPDYALRELLAGKVQQLCDAHNRVKAADDPGEAINAILQSAGFQARTAISKVSAVAQAMSDAFKANDQVTSESLQREIMQSLMLQANQLWRKARNAKFLEGGQPLSCFPGGALLLDPTTGALQGPGGSFNCLRAERCAAAQYMSQNKIDLQKLIDALHPDRLGKEAGKQENKTRRTALKELLNRGPKDFNKKYCRALGDAYFAIMAPPGYVVLTTNLVDHQHLCGALNKQAVKP
jgi:hypothetical protein